MKKILIFGSGCHAKVVFSEIVKLKKYTILGFVDDYSPKGKIIIKYDNKNFLNLGKIKDITNNKDLCGIIGVGSSVLRKKIFMEIKTKFKNFKYEAIISKDSIIDKNVKIGDGTIIISNSIINTGSVIGRHCLINTTNSIDHDNYFKDFAGTGPGVVTGGKVTIGKMSYLGIGSIIKNTVKVGDNTFIGGASFVNKNCEHDSLYFGVPAIKVKKNNLKR
tara:strand:+ start:21693 stop:22349 length:657 start_codon:yes stop_codon:yes gene_type:complete